MTRCRLCPGANNCVANDGPSNADILFIGEAPGIDENKQQRPFVGKTGQEVNEHYLTLAGLTRTSVLFDNAIKCLPTSSGGKLDPNRTKDLDLLQCCASHSLYKTIDRGSFSLLVPMGSFAIKAICPGVDLEHHHGFPVDTAWGIPAFPMYHPALGMHEPKKMLHIRNDWIRLGRYLKGALKLPTDPYPNPDYREVTDADEIDYLDPTLDTGFDTEWRKGGAPLYLTYSQRPGTGRLIRAERRDLLDRLQRKLRVWEGWAAFHHWLADCPIVSAMGLTFPHRHLLDTMVLAYHLGNLPQGLKTLAFRELGMEMQDFTDVVTPYSKELVLAYYRRAQDITWPKPEPQLVRDEKTGYLKEYKPQSMNTKLKRFFTDYGKNSDKGVFNMWETNWEDQQEAIEAELGEWPGQCLTHAPFDEQLFYACRDADATRRLIDPLLAMRRRVRKVSQENWRVL